MEWWIVTYRVPSEPSRHRVAVWRELRRAGAVSLQQAAWALPVGPQFDPALARATALVERAEGEIFVFAGRPDDATAGRLERTFTDAREAEWAEFLSECGKFEVEIDKEVSISKFTYAELDEEEQSLERLRRWYREIRSRDVLHAPSAPAAEVRLKECAEILERYAAQVYERGGS
jgi:hypothetical protein